MSVPNESRTILLSLYMEYLNRKIKALKKRWIGQKQTELPVLLWDDYTLNIYNRKIEALNTREISWEVSGWRSGRTIGGN